MNEKERARELAEETSMTREIFFDKKRYKWEFDEKKGDEVSLELDLGRVSERKLISAFNTNKDSPYNKNDKDHYNSIDNLIKTQ